MHSTDEVGRNFAIKMGFCAHCSSVIREVAVAEKLFLIGNLDES